jgi:hypothetical protein
MSYPPYPSGSTEEVTAVEEYVLGPENIPFFTTKASPPGPIVLFNINNQWFPAKEEPKAHIVFVHGM